MSIRNDGDGPHIAPRFRPEPLTLSLLLLALSTLFLCSIDKGCFYRPGRLEHQTVKFLVIAENLSPDHQFRLFARRRPGPDDAPTYDMYSRFPVGGYALIKLAMLPFGNDLPARILAARMLMLLLFSGAALLAFHSLARITSHRWVALAATLAAFSSYYMLLYGSAVAVEYSVDLFAVMLAFHGMVVFVQEGRFRQLLAKTCVALLLGWHVYAFLLPFILLGLACEAVRAWKRGTAPRPRMHSTAAALLRSRYTALGVAALLFGMAVLSFNLANEYAAFGGETAVSELPSFQFMLKRTGLDRPFEAPEWWLDFLRGQFLRVGVASVPFVLADWGVDLLNPFPSLLFSALGLSGPETSFYLLLLLLAAGAAAVVVRLARSLLPGRSRILVATLALSGFCWALLVRHNVAYPAHSHEALYYVGVPLVFYSLLLLYVHKRWGRGPVVGLAVAALLAFVVSAFQMERLWRHDPRTAEFQQAARAELGTIRETTRGKAVLVLGSVKPEWYWPLTHKRLHWRYYLTGSVVVDYLHLHMAFPSDYYPRNYLSGSGMTHFLDMETAARATDFIVTLDRVESDALLTPGNERVFLYDATGIDDLLELYRATYQRVVSGSPAARDHFDVYLDDGALYHVKEPCGREDVRGTVFADVFPADLKDLPGWPWWNGFRRGWRGRQGFERLRVAFQESGVLFEGKCMAILPLPDYPISGIWTGKRYPTQRDRNWKVGIGVLRRPGSPTP